MSMPPKSRMSQKRSNMKSKCDEVNDTRICERNDVCKLKRNIVNHLVNVQRSGKTSYALHKTCRDVLFHKISTLSLYKRETPFNRRITFIEWHPKHPETLAVASKGGDILLWNYGTTVYQQQMIQGKGAGGSVQTIKFHPEKELKIYTTAIDGTVCTWDYLNKTCKIFLETNNYNKWYTSLDVCFTGGHFVAGDNTGQLSMLSLDGKKMWEIKLHKNKITHAEYNPRLTWLLTTASVDRTVQMWDIRFIKGRENVLTVLHHDYPVNSAYFSSTDCSRLLTTDQHSQLRIYKAPLWQLETIIPHPHRHFQHITPIKATWHPLEDIVVVGRYPDEKFDKHVAGELRAIDFFDAETGAYRYKLEGLGGITSLNRFNIQGDTLASGMGLNILIWRPNRGDEVRRELMIKMCAISRARKEVSKKTQTVTPRKTMKIDKNAETSSHRKR